MAEVDIRYLLPNLRLALFDMTEEYKYTDEFLEASLLSAVKILGRRWRNRYIPTTDYFVVRNSDVRFSLPEPPVIEPGDEAVIVLQALIIVRTAEVYNSTWDVASWKDDEISYSNIQGAKSRDAAIAQYIADLEELLKRRLHPGKYSPLHGFHRNRDEFGV